MDISSLSDRELEQRLASRLMDVLIRLGLILALVMLCYKVLSPFVPLMVWALILAVTIYPLQQCLVRKIRGKQGLTASLLVIFGILLIAAPTAMLMSSLGDSVNELFKEIQNNSLKIPAPRPGIERWPIVGEEIHELWSKAHADLPALVQSMQPKIGELAKKSLSFVAGIGTELLQFIASFIIAGVVIAFGESGSRAGAAIFKRIFGNERGGHFAGLAAATVRAVAQGVIGVAFIQAILVGLALLGAGVPWAGVLAAIVLVLGIAQVPSLIVILPSILYIWTSGGYGNGAAIAYSVALLVAGMADNVLKPLMLGRGVDAPMPVVLLGALGGVVAAGILGMFVGAVLLTLGYQIFMGWVAANPEDRQD